MTRSAGNRLRLPGSRPGSWRPASLLALMLALACGLAGCSNFFYNRLDTLAAWYIQDLVSLDAAQRSDLRAWLDSTLQWHRRTELTRYSQFLRGLAGTAEHVGNTTTYKEIETQVETFGARVVEQAAPDAARLLLSLSPAQLTEFETNLAKKSRERNAESLKALANGKWHEQRAKDIEKQLKRWTGSITKEQQQLIAAESERFDSTTEDWLESQARWRKVMFGALQERFIAGQSPVAIEERVLTLLRTPETQWTRAYQAKTARNREQSLLVLAAIDASLTPTQRSHLQRELTELARRIEGMMAR